MTGSTISGSFTLNVDTRDLSSGEFLTKFNALVAAVQDLNGGSVGTGAGTAANFDATAPLTGPLTITGANATAAILIPADTSADQGVQLLLDPGVRVLQFQVINLSGVAQTVNVATSVPQAGVAPVNGLYNVQTTLQPQNWGYGTMVQNQSLASGGTLNSSSSTRVVIGAPTSVTFPADVNQDGILETTEYTLGSSLSIKVDLPSTDVQAGDQILTNANFSENGSPAAGVYSVSPYTLTSTDISAGSVNLAGTLSSTGHSVVMDVNVQITGSGINSNPTSASLTLQ